MKNKKGLICFDTPKDTLITLFMFGGAVAAASLSPAILAPVIVIKALQDKGVRRKYLQNAYYLKRKGLVKHDKKKNEIILTQKGILRATKHVLSRIDSSKTVNGNNRAWDGTWRIFMYDIPAGERTKRNAIRQVIKKIGMVQFQKSVWIYPFDCTEEIGLVKNVFSLGDESVRLILSKDIGESTKFKKIFKL